MQTPTEPSFMQGAFNLRLGGCNPAVLARDLGLALVMDANSEKLGRPASVSFMHTSNVFLRVSEAPDCMGDVVLGTAAPYGGGSAVREVLRFGSAGVGVDTLVAARYANLAPTYLATSPWVPPSAQALNDAYLALSNVSASVLAATAPLLEPWASLATAFPTVDLSNLPHGVVAGQVMCTELRTTATGRVVAANYANLVQDFWTPDGMVPASGFALSRAFTALSNMVANAAVIAFTAGAARAGAGAGMGGSGGSNPVLAVGPWLPSVEGQYRLRFEPGGTTSFGGSGFRFFNTSGALTSAGAPQELMTLSCSGSLAVSGTVTAAGGFVNLPLATPTVAGIAPLAPPSPPGPSLALSSDSNAAANAASVSAAYFTLSNAALTGPLAPSAVRLMGPLSIGGRPILGAQGFERDALHLSSAWTGGAYPAPSGLPAWAQSALAIAAGSLVATSPPADVATPWEPMQDGGFVRPSLPSLVVRASSHGGVGAEPWLALLALPAAASIGWRALTDLTYDSIQGTPLGAAPATPRAPPAFPIIGEWLELEWPSAIVPRRVEVATTSAARISLLARSTDSATWDLLSEWSWSGDPPSLEGPAVIDLATLPPTPTNALRLVVTSLRTDLPASDGRVAIAGITVHARDNAALVVDAASGEVRVGGAGLVCSGPLRLDPRHGVVGLATGWRSNDGGGASNKPVSASALSAAFGELEAAIGAVDSRFGSNVAFGTITLSNAASPVPVMISASTAAVGGALQVSGPLRDRRLVKSYVVLEADLPPDGMYAVLTPAELSAMLGTVHMARIMLAPSPPTWPFLSDGSVQVGDAALVTVSDVLTVSGSFDAVLPIYAASDAGTLAVGPSGALVARPSRPYPMGWHVHVLACRMF